MKTTIVSLLTIIVFIFQGCVAPPVTKNKTADSDKDAKENEIPGQETGGLEDYMEYHRYLKEVVDALESDSQFREKLEKAEESDIRTGKIAHELEFVGHKVRTRLDELKRAELERLRHLANKQYEIENGLNDSHGKVDSNHHNNNNEDGDKEHIDHTNPHTFEIEDLKKLIAKSTQDLAEADRKRREEFKEYEMQKEFEKQEKLKSLDDIHRVEMEKQMQEREEKHKKHQPLHHPGSKQQLEEVWEKQDHMDQQDFDPKTFFMLHDLDGNGVWDQDEVKTLFIKELDKMYSEAAPEDDMRERIEEMERMREHVFGEVDKNKDGLISYEEFLDQTKRQDFQEDKGWESLDQQKVFTADEYQQFEKQRMEEIERLIAQGMLPPHPGAPYHDPRMQGHNQFPPQGHHPGQVPQGYQGQAHPQAQYHPGQVPQQQYHPGQIPQQQYHPGQVPQQQYQHAQQVAQQYHPAQGQVPPQQQHHQGQLPPQQQQHHQGQLPPQQQQHHQGQVPPQQHNQGQAPPQQHQGQMQMNNEIKASQVPPQGNPAGQGQQNQNPQLNTNEVYVGQSKSQPNSQEHRAQVQPVVQQPNQPQPAVLNQANGQGSPQAQQV